MELTATCGRWENVMRVHERLKTKIKLFFSRYLVCILISLWLKPKSYLKVIKEYIFSEVQVQVQVHIFRIVPHGGLVFDSLTFVTKIITADKSLIDQ